MFVWWLPVLWIPQIWPPFQVEPREQRIRFISHLPNNQTHVLLVFWKRIPVLARKSQSNSKLHIWLLMKKISLHPQLKHLLLLMLLPTQYLPGPAPVLPTTVLTNQAQLEAHLQLALQSGASGPELLQALPDFNQVRILGKDYIRGIQYTLCQILKWNWWVSGGKWLLREQMKKEMRKIS